MPTFMDDVDAELASRLGGSSQVTGNSFDFENPPRLEDCTGSSCGDALANYLNTGPLKGTGASLPSGGIGPGDLANAGKARGAVVYGRDLVSPESLTPGTVIHMTRRPGDRNYNYGSTHIGIVDIDENGSKVFKSYTAGKGWRVEPVDQRFVGQLPAKITATNPVNPDLDDARLLQRADKFAYASKGKDFNMDDVDKEIMARTGKQKPVVDKVEASTAAGTDFNMSAVDDELNKRLGGVKKPEEGVMSQIGGWLGQATDYVKGILSPGINQDLQKAKAEFLKKNPDATEAEVAKVQGKLEKESAAHQMTLREAYSKNIRDFASGIITPIQGVAKAVGKKFEPFGTGMADVQKELGLSRRVGPERYGTEGEGAESRGIIEDVLRPEDEKRYAGEGLVRAPGRVLGTLVPYVGAGKLAQAGGMVLTPASTFLEKLLFNTATFMPVDLAAGYKEADMAGVDQALWHSPITAALFTVGGLPKGKVGGTVGVGLAGAGSAAAAGERDPEKLAEAFGTMAILHNILGTKPERAKAEVEKFVTENKLSEGDVAALKDKLEGYRKQYEADKATPEQRAPEPSPEQVQAEVEKLKQEYLAGEEAASLVPGDLPPDVVEVLKKGDPVSPAQQTILEDRIKAALIGPRTTPENWAWEQHAFPGVSEVDGKTVVAAKTPRTMASGAEQNIPGPTEVGPSGTRVSDREGEVVKGEAGKIAEQQAFVEDFKRTYEWYEKIKSEKGVEAADEALRNYRAELEKDFDGVEVATAAEKRAADEVAAAVKEEGRQAGIEDEGVVPMYSGGPDTSSLMQRLAPVFYSKMQRHLESKLPERSSPQNIARLVKTWMGKGEFKADDLKWSGLTTWLEGQKGPVTRQQVLDYLEGEGKVEVREVEKGSGNMWEIRTADGYLVAIDLESRAEAEKLIAELNSDQDSLFKDYNLVPVESETTKREVYKDTKFQSWMKLPPGGENYREFLLTTPGKSTEAKFEVHDVDGRPVSTGYGTRQEAEAAARNIKLSYPSTTKDMELNVVEVEPYALAEPGGFSVPESHKYGDFKADTNRFAHVFTDDRIINGKKYLTIWEMQSDWGRQLDTELSSFRESNYPRLTEIDKELSGALTKEDSKRLNKEKSQLEAQSKQDFVQQKEVGKLNGEPLSPMWGRHNEVTLKKMLRKAAEEGYDGVAWATGDMVKDRYDLSKQVDKLRAIKDGDNFSLEVIPTGMEDWQSIGRSIPRNKLSDYIPKEVAERIATQEKSISYYEGEDLKIGGEWANRQYDQMMPQFLNKYGKQWGARAETGKVAVGGKYDRSVFQGRDIPPDAYGIYESYRPDAITYFYSEADALKYRNERYAANKVNDRWAVIDLVGEEPGGIEKGDVVSYYDTESMARKDADERNIDEKAGEPIHTLNLTPSMKKSVLYEGQAMYSGGPDTTEWFKSLFKTSTAEQAQLKSEVRKMPVVTEAEKNLNMAEVGNTVEAADIPQTRIFKAVADALTGGEYGRTGGKPTTFKRLPRHGLTNVEKFPASPTRDIGFAEKELMSNNITANNVFKGHNNPVTEFHGAQLEFMLRRLNYEGVPDNIVSKYGLKQDVKDSLVEGTERLSPLFERWLELHEAEARMTSHISALEGQLRDRDPKSAHGKELAIDIKRAKDELKVLRAENQSAKSEVYKLRTIVLNDLMKKYANVRIKMALGGDAKAEALLTPDERKIVLESRKYYDEKKAEMQKQGMKVIDEDYVNFVFKNGLNSNDAGAGVYAKNLWYGRKPLVPYFLDFVSRTPGSKDWFPFWYQSIKQYIPSVERKLSFNPYLEKWVTAAKQWNIDKPGVFDWFTDFHNKNFGVEETGLLDRAVNGLINLEYSRTLALNLAPPILHLFKLLQTPAWHGIIPTAKGLYRYSKAVGQKALGLEGPERQAMELYVRLPSLIRAVEQSPGMEHALSPVFWRRALGQTMYAARKLGTGLTTLIEHFDNGVNLMAVIERGASGGQTPGLINAEILDSLMRLNFRGFNMPKVMTGTLGRTVSMYAGQPTKLMENKLDLLYKSLTGQKDAFGNRYLYKAIRLAVLMGMAYSAGQEYDVDLLKHLIHAPAMAPSRETGEYTLSFKTPPIQLAGDIADKGLAAGLWQHFAQIPALDRVFKFQEGDVGRKFENEWTQLLGLPKSDWHEDLISRRRLYQMREKRRHPMKERRMKSPTQRRVEDLYNDMFNR